MKQPYKLYIVQKYIYASSSKDALRKEKKQEVDECYVDQKWRDANFYQPPKEPIGFSK